MKLKDQGVLKLRDPPKEFELVYREIGTREGCTFYDCTLKKGFIFREGTARTILRAKGAEYQILTYFSDYPQFNINNSFALEFSPLYVNGGCLQIEEPEGAPDDRYLWHSDD